MPPSSRPKPQATELDLVVEVFVMDDEDGEKGGLVRAARHPLSPAPVPWGGVVFRVLRGGETSSLEGGCVG